MQTKWGVTQLIFLQFHFFCYVPYFATFQLNCFLRPSRTMQPAMYPSDFLEIRKITCLNNLSCRVKLLVSEITHLFPLLKTSYIRLMRYHRTEKPQCQYGTPWRGCKADEYRKLCSEPLRTKFKYFNFQIQQKWKEEVLRNSLIWILLDVLWKNDSEVHLQST